jgi:hypothetical protein
VRDSPKAIDEVDDSLRGGCTGFAFQGKDGVVFSRIRIDSAFFLSHSSASFLLSFVKADGGCEGGEAVASTLGMRLEDPAAI